MLLKYFSKDLLEAGTDEAGRGCLAGPVTAAAVILVHNNKESKAEEWHFFEKLINDSKQISEKTRIQLKPIIESIATTFAITHIEPKIIDDINILNSAIKAMQDSTLALNPLPEHLIVDGNRFKPMFNIPHTTIIKGDSKYMSIAAASVLAKTYRDDFMDRIHEEYPMYNWKKNKGYPTVEHREAIKKYGTTPYHRLSFKLLAE